MPVLAKHPSSYVEVLPTFEQLAHNLAARLSSIVPLPLLITDAPGHVIVVSDRGGQNAERSGGAHRQVRIPFRIAECDGAVVFCCRGSSWEESPGVLAAITRQLVSQTLDPVTVQPRRKPGDLFVYRLLTGDYANKREALELAQLWHIDLTMPRSVILLEGSESSQLASNSQRATRQKQLHMQKVRDSITDLFTGLDDETTGAYIGGGRVALLMAQGHPKANNKQVSGTDFARKARTILEKATQMQSNGGQSDGDAKLFDFNAMHVAAGNPYPGVYGLNRSYREALQSLEKAIDPCARQLPRTSDIAPTPYVAGKGFSKYSGAA